jgi:ribulose bisphosphate carboxylase small subunit
MAPERPPRLVVFDSKIGNGELRGSAHYVEPKAGVGEIRVRWNVESQPADFMPVADGVAYVLNRDEAVDVLPVSEDARAQPRGGRRYRWSEGLGKGQPSLMFALILPQGYTLTDPDPVPVDTKSFRERLALYWMLEGGSQQRAQVEWTLEELRGDLESEMIRINQFDSAGEMGKPTEIGLV